MEDGVVVGERKKETKEQTEEDTGIWGAWGERDSRTE